MNRQIGILVLALISVAAGRAQAAPGRYPISAVQIAQVVSSSGVQVSAGQIAPFTEVTAAVSSPELQVEAIDRLGDGRVIARIGCATSNQCLPFLVALDSTVQSSPGVVPHRPSSSPRRPVQFSILQGSRTALYLDGAHVHIVLTVICLESGVPGQIVRATSLDRHQAFRAQVAADGSLRGRL